MNLLKNLFFLAAITVGLNSYSQDCIPAKPNPPKLVNDFAGVISDDVEQKLERVLVGFYDTTSTQIAIITVKELCGRDVASFAFKLGETWGVGDAKFNNGVVVLVKPKYPTSKGEVKIATGYGLEGVLPDAIAKRIVENEMIPAFKQENYEDGIINAAFRIIDITGGEYSAENYNNNRLKNKKPASILPFFFLLFIIIIMLAGTFGRARKYSRTNNTGLWAALFLMGSMNSRHTGHFNNFRSGRGGFGGFGGGGGGFGGFGGGSFGGGGAGGSW